ncbi:MAG: bifunctional 5,10-methylenetetrahydrofolate dehydrogenase/5,10-methenyltetrahydrofolate cyclohydrolase [Candidatus Omnitrophota bacterium]
MSAKLLDGKLLAANLKQSLKQEIETLKKKTGTAPCIANILLTDDPASLAYANSQKNAAESVGIQYRMINVAANSSQKELEIQIQKLNQDKAIHGIMLHKPVPAQINYSAAVNGIDPVKDVEGMGVANIGKLVLGTTKIIPCTAAAAMEHIRSTGVALRGKEAVIVGRSEIVGKPLSLLLLAESATVTICHTGTSQAGTLEAHVKRADIVVAAVGKPGFVKGEWIKKGAIVIDVGINKIDGKIVGDVEFEAAAGKAAFITPVPGGVGPVTAVIIMKNTLEAFKAQMGI